MRVQYYQIPACDSLKVPHIRYLGHDVANSEAYYYDSAQHKGLRRVVFQYTMSGCGLLAHQGKTYKVDKGKAFIFELGIPDSRYYYPADAVEPWEFVYCAFDFFSDAVSALNALHCGMVWTFGENNPVVKMLLRIVDDPLALENLTVPQNLLICGEIVAEMCRLLETPSASKGHAMMLKAKAWIFDRRSEAFSLAECAAALGISPEHLCRSFKHSFGVSPKQYHEKQRIDLIRRHLLNRGSSIKEIAYDVGFDNLAYFGKFFKKHTSLTPGEFRRTNPRPPHDLVD